MVAIMFGVKTRKDGLGHRPALISKTEMAVFPENDMIQERDPEELGTLAKPLRQHTIFRTGCWITGRMVMRTDTGSRIHEDERLKDLARVDDGQRQGTDRYDIDANNTVFGVEPTHEELLSIQAFKAGPEQARGGKRGLNESGWRKDG